jgi:hypothetical protein
MYIPPDIRGEDLLMSDGRTLKEWLTEVCENNKPVFNTKVRPLPAKVTPMRLVVDESIWHDSANSLAPRHHSQAKHAEVSKQVNKMMPLGVIRESNEEFYSQVHLTPKPTPGEWRFCIDYRRLNAASRGMGWPIPNIAEMLRRLGDRKPKYFCKLDLTAGYHQAPLDEESKKYTAFRTAQGLYEWNRVPMGLKGAPSYFQHVMQSEVLQGLQYVICEIYIDDIIIFADSREELAERLNRVLERLAKHNISVSPEKCSFGLQEVEFVGHTLDKDGLHFTRAKLDKVLQIELPKTSKQLKSFLGVTIFFSDHIQGYTDLAKPLHNMIHDYDARRKLKWTPFLEEVFYKVRDAVNTCPKLFFIDPGRPIYVATDASDYGVGAICYQVIEDKVVPINFMSKSLSAQECNWTTTEKECFAIVHALRKFEYLLRDVHFTLLTDHKNLIYIDSETSQKVKRWKLAIQQYDFDIQHIPGRLNQIADGFSRLLEVPEEMVMWMNEPLADEMRTSHSMAFCFAGSSGDFASDTLLWLSEYEIPKDKESIIAQHHNESVGHHGIQRTIASILKEDADGRPLNQAWDGMRVHVKRFIQRCPCCQKMSYLKVPIHTHRYTVASSRPWDRINMDRIGPLPPNGRDSAPQYTSILVIIDCFSR